MGIREGSASVSVWQVVKAQAVDVVGQCAKENAKEGLVGWRHWQDWITAAAQLSPATGLTMLQWMECKPSVPGSLYRTELAKAVLRWQAEHEGQRLTKKQRKDLAAGVKAALLDRAQPSFRGIEFAYLEDMQDHVLTTAASDSQCGTFSHQAQVLLGLTLRHDDCATAVRAAGLDERNWKPVSFKGKVQSGKRKAEREEQGELFADDCWHDFLTWLFFCALKSDKCTVRMEDSPIVLRSGPSGRAITLKKWQDQPAAVFAALGRGAKLEKMRVMISVEGENGCGMVVGAELTAGSLILKGCKVHGMPRDELDPGRIVRLRATALLQAWEVLRTWLLSYADMRSSPILWAETVARLRAWVAEEGQLVESGKLKAESGQPSAEKAPAGAAEVPTKRGGEDKAESGKQKAERKPRTDTDGHGPSTVNITAATAATVDEALVRQACQVISDSGRASVSTIQRRLKLGYTAAANIMDVLEERGIVGPAKGSEPREIFLKPLQAALKPAGKKGGRK